MNLVTLFERLPPDTIATIAGAGYRDGIPAKEADAGWPLGVVRRPDGELIVADHFAHRLWRIDGGGILRTFAGDGVPGNSGDGGPASRARLNHPHDLAQDKEGNLYVSDIGNAVYRRIDYKTGVITRIAGSGKVGRGGDGGTALDAEMDAHCGIAVDEEGNVYLSSEWANNIRRIDARTGVIELFAGQDARHRPSETGSSRPYSGSALSLGGYSGDGGPAKDAGFHHPEHLAFHSKGDLYVCDNSNHRVRKIDMQTGTITTVLGTGQPASNGDGGLAAEASTLEPDAICLDVHDNLYVGEKYGFRVRKVDAATGVVTTLVGTGVPGFGEDGLPGPQTRCNSCEAGVWADPDGTVLWSDCSGRLRRYDGETGIVTTVLGGTGVHDGAVATEGFLSGPGGLSVGPDGHIYIADVWSQLIRAIDPSTGVIRTVAGNGARAYGGDNGPATEAYLGNPHDVSVDSLGRVVIADTRHGHVRRIDLDGVIRNVAGAAFQWDKGDGGPAVGANLMHVRAMAHGPNDDIYIGDAGAGRIRKVDADSGIITTVAGVGAGGGYSWDGGPSARAQTGVANADDRGDGGPAVRARVGAPTAIRFDGAGNLYFSDSAHHVVRKIGPNGTITTVVGTGEEGFSPDGTPAMESRLSRPWGLEVSTDGMIFVSDTGNNRVRRIGRDGIVTTVAGSETAGDAGDGGPAVEASLNEPRGLRLYGKDILLIADNYNNRIKAVKLSI